MNKTKKRISNIKLVRKKKTTMDITTYLNKKFKRGNSSCSLLEQYESYVKLLRFDMNHNDLNKTTLKMKMGNSIIEYEISEDNLLLFILTEYLNQSPIWEVEIIFNEVLHKPLFKIIVMLTRQQCCWSNYCYLFT